MGPRGGGELTWIVSVQVVCLVTNSARLLSTRIKHSPIRIHKNMTSYTKRCLNNLNSQIVCLFLPFTVSVHCPTFLCRHYRVHYSTSLCRHYRECIIPLSSAGITESALFHFTPQALQRVHYSTSLCRHYRECIIPLPSAGITESALFHFPLQALQRVHYSTFICRHYRECAPRWQHTEETRTSPRPCHLRNGLSHRSLVCTELPLKR